MIVNVSSTSNWWRKSEVEAGKLSMSPAQLAAEALQGIHSAKSSHDWALLGRPRRGALNPQVKPQRKPQGCG